ncbi:Vir1p CYBJADRAFT_62192 [Cyberlindnera jadinii NRRL Y-1542]|uniref:Uncharacterized protein n=2 Tax=Cyberlindnera jadinii (strain ATCC 18201 / CBS 1600 / BCRC 20928 / JCM 3617 / NBRC 0987 / NRRL Y-1542) TaxID=983966 RepID=A0A1E4S5J8_CYBJN|nr:hypothetical protein CYBJADRAFT_62192 [Cyberlindnera jadinii NRRL Y-1542]ODV74789.1 hypothetical protein CYBJADRAFT_62192 [Cyberlindnera jadinii NRRL Y-1542]
MSMPLEDKMSQMDISSEAGVLKLSTDLGGIICLVGNPESRDDDAALVQVLNEIKALSDSKNYDDEVLPLLRKVGPWLTTLDESCLIGEDTRQFIRVVSLLCANDKINELIKSEMTPNIIDTILKVYLKILDTLKDLGSLYSNLLSNLSLISPLLITISFSFKMKYDKSDTLTKVLALLFIYHLTIDRLLENVVKMFSVNSSTNMDVFEVFNKLWERTLQLPTTTVHDIKRAPGPITILNKIHLLKDLEMSADVIEQVFPYLPNEILLGCSKQVSPIYSALLSLKSLKGDVFALENSTTDISLLLSNLITSLNSDLACELMLLLADVLDVSDSLLELDQGPFGDVVKYIIFKISSTLDLKNPLLNTKLLSRIMNTEFLGALHESIYARYKVIFELIDHNYKIDFTQDFQMAILLERSLSSIDSRFELVEDHHVVSEYGSIFSIDSLFLYSNFIINKSILQFVNPNKQLPQTFMDYMNLKRFAPLPRSNFTDIHLDGIPTSQINANNVYRLINGSLLCLSIQRKILQQYMVANEDLNLKVNFDGNHVGLSYRCMDKAMKLCFTSLFTSLMISTELKHSGVFNPEYTSAAKILKLKVFGIFQDLFQLYGSFAFYLLLKFITEASNHDLELHAISIGLLNHIIFHSDNGLEEQIQESRLITLLLTSLVKKWDDGSDRYRKLARLMGLPRVEMVKVKFDKITLLKELGFSEQDLIRAQTPTTSTSSTHSLSFNICDMGQDLTNINNINMTPMNKFSPASQSFPFSSTSQNFGEFDIPQYGYNSNRATDHNYKAGNLNNVISFVPQQSLEGTTGFHMQFPQQPLQHQPMGFYQPM